MAKILLVEDDNNLREIYQARLQAEGYQIVTASDGEEALVVAKSEKPDLIISDIMMPKISGFEMLDILRNTEGLKNVKVIMLTALGQNDDQERANKLGADRYLVKSQVTLEDIIKVSHELLADGGGGPAGGPTPVNDPPATPQPEPPTNPPVEPVSPPTPPTPMNPPVDPPSAPVDQPTQSQEQASVNAQVEEFAVGAEEATTPVPPVAQSPSPPPVSPPPMNDQTSGNLAHDDGLIDDAVKQLGGDTPVVSAVANAAPPTPPVSDDANQDKPAADMGVHKESPSMQEATRQSSTFVHNKVIQPLPSQPKTNINVLAAEEEAKEAGDQVVTPPSSPQLDGSAPSHDSIAL